MSKPTAVSLALAGFTYLGTPYSSMDCQVFVERCMKDVGINRNLPGSNAWYRAMTWTGTPEECKSRFGSIPAGAFLFILEQDGKEPAKYREDGIGNASHIGIRTGRGQGAIHSSAGRGCVCESVFSDRTIRNGGWNRVGLWDAFDYGTKINEMLKGGESIMSVNKTVWAEKGTNVFLRAQKNTGAGYLTRIPVGETIQVLEDDGIWSSVRWHGWSGYMMSRFLKDVSENGTSALEDVSTSGKEGASSFNPAAAPDPVMGQGSVTLTIPAYVTQGNISLTVPAALAQMMLPLAESAVSQLVSRIGRG